MSANKQISMGSVFVPASAGNLLNPPTLTGGTGLLGVNNDTFLIVRQIILTNVTSGPATVSLFRGATAGSSPQTAFWVDATTIPANQSLIWTGILRLDAADFLSGIASAGSTISFLAAGEIGVL